MARPREIKFIENRRRRTVTYRKRKASLAKAAFELSTLCNVPTAVVCFDPDGRPDTWPDDDGAVRGIVAGYRNLVAQERCKPAIAQLRCLAGQVGEYEGQNLMGCGLSWLDGLPEESLRELAYSMESSLEPVRNRIQLLRGAERDQSSHCSTGEQGQSSLPNTPMEYPDAPIESTAALEQSGGFICSSEDPVMAFDPYPVNNAFTDVPVELNQVDTSSYASTYFNHGQEQSGGFICSSEDPVMAFDPYPVNNAFTDVPVEPNQVDTSSYALTSFNHGQEQSGGFICSSEDPVMAFDPYPVNNAFTDVPVELNQVDTSSYASTSFNHGQKAMESLSAPSFPAPLPSTSEHNIAFDSDRPLFSPDRSFGFVESLFQMGGGDASPCLNHGHEAMRDSLASSAPSPFAMPPSAAAALAYNRAFGIDLPSLPPESRFPIGGGDASTFLNHGHKAMRDSMASFAPSSIATLPSIAATSVCNIAFGSNLPSLPLESSSGFPGGQFPMGGGESS